MSKDISFSSDMGNLVFVYHFIFLHFFDSNNFSILASISTNSDLAKSSPTNNL